MKCLYTYQFDEVSHTIVLNEVFAHKCIRGSVCTLNDSGTGNMAPWCLLELNKMQMANHRFRCLYAKVLLSDWWHTLMHMQGSPTVLHAAGSWRTRHLRRDVENPQSEGTSAKLGRWGNWLPQLDLRCPPGHRNLNHPGCSKTPRPGKVPLRRGRKALDLSGR